jgi:DNA polymerase-3 subunit chi
MEAFFYHLERRSLEDVLPELLERTLARGWRAMVAAGSEERANALDAHLWTYRDDSFLPHGLTAEALAAEQPILVGPEPSTRNQAQALFLAGGAEPGDWSALAGQGFLRTALLFDGRDEDAVMRARAHWKAVKAAGLAAQYWQQTPAGKWEKKA